MYFNKVPYLSTIFLDKGLTILLWMKTANHIIDNVMVDETDQASVSTKHHFNKLLKHF